MPIVIHSSTNDLLAMRSHDYFTDDRFSAADVTLNRTTRSIQRNFYWISEWRKTLDAGEELYEEAKKDLWMETIEGLVSRGELGIRRSGCRFGAISMGIIKQVLSHDNISIRSY